MQMPLSCIAVLGVERQQYCGSQATEIAAATLEGQHRSFLDKIVTWLLHADAAVVHCGVGR